jgi:Reverse transcriptase (RNA-dependent DNA polymerase)
MYMAIPRGGELPPEYNSKDYCLKLKKNIYGQKQAGRVWLKHLESGLPDIGFEPSKVLDCLYYRGSTVLLVYVDDMIVFDPSDAAIDQVYFFPFTEWDVASSNSRNWSTTARNWLK